MPKVESVENLEVIKTKPNPGSMREWFFLTATGSVPTIGWTNPRLVPRVDTPSDGILHFDFLADPPFSLEYQHSVSIFAQLFMPIPTWRVKKIIVHGKKKDFTLEIRETHGGMNWRPVANLVTVSNVFTRGIASYQDSFQPTGTIHWKNDGPFGAPNPHAEWKKLCHDLILTVEGPDLAAVNNCFNIAFTAALLAALGAAYASGGAAAAQAFVDTGVTALTACLGGGYKARVDDHSRWEYWDA